MKGPGDDWRARDVLVYAFWAGGILMWEWLTDRWPLYLFHHRCVNCGKYKQRGGHWCKDCFERSGW